MIDHDGGTADDNEDFVLKKAKRITKKHIDHAIRKAKEIEEKLKTLGPVGQFWNDIQLCQNLLKDYHSGRYRDVPSWIIAVIAFALLYLINPIELIPDVIPVVGYLDDAVLVAIAVKLAKNELQKYKEWKTHND